MPHANQRYTLRLCASLSVNSVHTTTLGQLLFRHVATGNASVLGLAAAHFSAHALSLQAQASAQSWLLAQVASAKHALIESPHLSNPHWHWSGQAAAEQSTAVACSLGVSTLIFPC